MNEERPFTTDSIVHLKSQKLSIEIIQTCQQLMLQKDYTIISPLM